MDKLKQVTELALQNVFEKWSVEKLAQVFEGWSAQSLQHAHSTLKSQVTEAFLADFMKWSAEHSLAEKLDQLQESSAAAAAADDNDDKELTKKVIAKEDAVLHPETMLGETKKRMLCEELARIQTKIVNAKMYQANLAKEWQDMKSELQQLDQATRHLKASGLSETISTLSSLD